KVEYYLSSVKGLSQIPLRTDYVLSVKGLGFGVAPSHRIYDVELRLEGQALPASAIVALPGHETRITIPHDLLDPQFPADRPKSIKATLKTTIAHPGFCVGDLCLSRSS